MVDVHPDYVDVTGPGQPGVTYHAEFYARFLDYVQRKYAGQYWMALPKDVAHYVRSGHKTDNSSAKAAVSAVP